MTRLLTALLLAPLPALADGQLAADPCAREFDLSEQMQAIDPFLSPEQADALEIAQVAWEARHCPAPVPATFAGLLIARTGNLAGVTDAELLDLGWAHQPGGRHGFRLGGGDQPAPSPVPVPASGLSLLAALGGLGSLRRRHR